MSTQSWAKLPIKESSYNDIKSRIIGCGDSYTIRHVKKILLGGEALVFGDIGFVVEPHTPANPDAEFKTTPACDHVVAMSFEDEELLKLGQILIKIAQGERYYTSHAHRPSQPPFWLKDIFEGTYFEHLASELRLFDYCPDCGQKIDWLKIKQGADELRAAGEAEFEQRERLAIPASEQQSSATVSHKVCQNEKNPPPCPTPDDPARP